MATIKARPSKKGVRYTAIVRWQGQTRTQTFGTKTAAKEWAKGIERDISEGKHTPSTEEKRRTVRDLLERYKKSEIPRKRDQRNPTRIANYWIDRIGDYKLTSVSRALIIEIRDDMAAMRAAATVNQYLAVLRHAFRVAQTDWAWTTHNPLQRIKLKEPKGRDRHLSDKEVERLVNAVEGSTHPHIKAVVLIALTTGARKGEILGLRWGDVDLIAGRARLHQTKNTDKRTIALVPRVVDALRELQKVRRIDDDRVFARLNDIGRRTHSDFEKAWREVRAEAELKDFRFHDLRHTFASRMAMDGRSLREIAEALGHRTLAMVQRYSHLTESHVQSAMKETGLKILDT